MSRASESSLFVVDGDPVWRQRIAAILAAMERPLREFANGREALQAAREQPPGLVVCEHNICDLSGTALCRTLREDPKLGGVGFLMVSAQDSEMDRVLAFEAGVDDFLAKPFFGRELLWRAIAIVRRVEAARRPKRPAGLGAEPDVEIDRDGCCVRIGSRRIDLTPRERDILCALVEEQGRVITRDELLGRLGGSSQSVSLRVIDTHVKAIRRKLGRATSRVETVRGVGYRFADATRAGKGG